MRSGSDGGGSHSALHSRPPKAATPLSRTRVTSSVLLGAILSSGLVGACVDFDSVSHGLLASSPPAPDGGVHALADAASYVTRDAAGSSPESDAMGACLAYVGALCQRTADCQNAGPAAAQKCIAFQSTACPDQWFGASSTVTPAEVATCTAALDTFTCDAIVAKRYPVCGSPGTRPTGASCSFDHECASQHCAGQGCGLCADRSTDGGCANGLGCPEGEACVAGACGAAGLGAACDQGA